MGGGVRGVGDAKDHHGQLLLLASVFLMPTNAEYINILAWAQAL